MTPWQAEHCTLKQAMPRDFSGTAGVPARNASGAASDLRTACARLSHALEHGQFHYSDEKAELSFDLRVDLIYKKRLFIKDFKDM